MTSGIGVALQLDNDAVTLAVGFVAQVRNTLDALVLDQFGHLLDHRRLVHLEGNFGDDDLLAIAAHRLDGGAAAHDDRAAAGLVGGADAGAAKDERAGRKVRTRNDLHQLRQFQSRLVDQGDTAIDDFDQVVRRDVGRHADGDAAGAVDQKIREFCRNNRRFAQGAVIVVAKIDRFLVEVVEQRMGCLLQAALGVAFGRRRVAVDGAEIALTVDQRQAQRPGLCHAGERVIDRRVAVADGIYPSRRR